MFENVEIFDGDFSAKQNGRKCSTNSWCSATSDKKSSTTKQVSNLPSFSMLSCLRPKFSGKISWLAQHFI